MTNQHPITPPPELVQQWHDECHKVHEPFLVHIANQAARWGADQELEACVEWVVNTRAYDMTPGALRTARRPKPSLKEQALEALQFVDEKLKGHLPLHNHCNAIHTISRALDALDD